jgi:hypothetical protein
MSEDRKFLLSQAEKCRRLAREVADQTAGERLVILADEYERRADEPTYPSPVLNGKSSSADDA